MSTPSPAPWILGLQEPTQETGKPEPSPEPAGETDDATLPEDTLGLALSGGGIRSAAFSLGIIQALARAGWLKHIDFLSTVSGGGYTGTFLGRFFDQCKKPAGLAGPYGDVAGGAAQERVTRELADSRSQTISWLRHHANYLSPSGLGESLFNFATFWRNFLSLHFVLGIYFFAVFGIVNSIGYNDAVLRWLHSAEELIGGLLPLVSWLPNSVSTFWPSLAELVLWLAIVPLMFAYWLGSQDRHREFVVTFFISCLLLAVAGLIATRQPVCIAIFVAAVGWTLESWIAISHKEGHGNPASRWRMALGRNHLTYRLAFWVAAGTSIVGLTLVDALGQSLARSWLMGEWTWSESLTWIGSVVGTILALAPTLRMLAGYLATREEESTSLLAAIGRIPYLPTILILAIGAFLPLVALSVASHVAFGLGYSYYQGIAATGVALLVSLLLGTRESLPFVNRSGPLTIYAARLARVFMGAVNPLRHRHVEGQNVAHVIEGDDVAFGEYEPHAAGGPLHIFNVAVNETVDIASQRGIRDRQSENMGVGPAGLSISTAWHALWQASGRVEAISDGSSLHPLRSRTGGAVDVEPLTVRQWMGISGAAISPGLGRLTGPATALLFTLANLRLGYWWKSGLRSGDRAGIPFRYGIFGRIKNAFFRFLSGQSLLVAELRGRFGGPWRQYWYLSDGGHFENSGVYELLRRRVRFIIMCGAGQDRKHEGTDIAELSRIARIDLGAEIEPVGSEPKDWSALGVPGHVVEHLGLVEELLASDSKLPAKHATLLRARFPGSDSDAWHGRDACWILYIKATVVGDEPMDVRNYQSTHPDFPNETTLDQFFDERQWESYRKLGDHIGTKLFRA